MINNVNRELFCVLTVSLAFFLLFAADYSMYNIQKVIVSSIADDVPGFQMEGYQISAILYTTFAITVWVGPYVTYRIGPKLTMLIASFGYLMFIVVYAVEWEWFIYVGAVVGGAAAGILWPAQGQYMVESSSPQFTARNFAIFYLIMTGASMFGNIFVYTEFHGKKYIDGSTRRRTLYSLAAISVISTIAFISLPKTNNEKEIKNRNYGVIKTIKTSLKLLISGNMPWLCVTFIYAGIQQAFWTGIYGSCLGFTLGFGDAAKELVALSGIVGGVGSLLGSMVPIVLSGPIRKYRFSRRIIVLVGVSAQLLTFLSAYFNLPDSSVFGNTYEASLIEPSKTLALLGSVLLTIGDACIITQEYAYIGDHYRHASAEACALYKSVKGILVSASFYVCGHIGLHTQLAVMSAMGVAGVAAYWVADRDNVSHDDHVLQNKLEIKKAPK